MSGLVLKLAPRERVLINGAVLENGDKRARISIISPNANVLRLRDALHPDDANTPVRRVCYICQLLISGDAEEQQGRQQVLHGIEQLESVFLDAGSNDLLGRARSFVNDGNYYQATKQLRRLLLTEAYLLGVGR